MEVAIFFKFKSQMLQKKLNMNTQVLNNLQSALKRTNPNTLFILRESTIYMNRL